MTQVWERSQQAGTDLLVMLALADFSDDGGSSYPAVTTLAAKCRMKPRNMNYILASLVRSGELQIRANEGPKGTNRYRIVIEKLGMQSNAGMQRSAGVQRSAPTPATQCALPLQPLADKPSLNRQEPSLTSLSRHAELNCPQKEIRALYAEILPSLPQPKKWDADRQKALRSRWREQVAEKSWKSVDDGLRWFRRFFEAVNENDWAMGRTGRGKGHEDWECSIDYLLSVKGFRRIIETAGRVRDGS